MERRVVKSRQELIELIADIQSSRFDNHKTDSYLEALGAWLADCDGFYMNIGETRDCDAADWQLIADALCAATIYQ